MSRVEVPPTGARPASGAPAAQRTTLWLSLLLAAQVGVAAALWMQGGDRLAPPPADSALIVGDLAAVDRLSIDGPKRQVADPAAPPAGASGVELRRTDGRWRLPGYHDVPADAAKVEALTDLLGRLQRGGPVATTPSAWPRFRVAANEHERRLLAAVGDKALATLYVGTAPGVRKSHVRLDGDDAIYPVELATSELSADPVDWFDARLLGRDTAPLRTVTVTVPGRPAFTMTRGAAEAAWQTAGLPPGRALSPDRAKTLVDLIGGVQATRVLGTADRPEWQQAAPLVRLSIGDGAGEPVGWTVSRPKGETETLVLKVSDRPWFVELTDWQARAVIDAVDTGRFVVDAASLAPPAEPASAAASDAAPAPAAVSDTGPASAPASAAAR